MSDTIEIKDIEERVILVSVCLGNMEDTTEALNELEELVKTAGAITVGRITQNRDAIHNKTYIGKGKVDEIRDMVEEYKATGIVCDDELSPSQIRNLQEELEIKVMDRTLIILDIFAARALTREGKIQVELAQLKYRSSRLIGLRSSLSRLGGGIGTKGPGEKKLEMDRRLIRDRISQLSTELDDVKRHRDVQRQQRSKNQTPVICIVGYTNAGKSTLLNQMTSAGVLEEDKLFATLDPTTRTYELPSGQQIMLTDTVGFIRKLPHHLVEAFRSTLEEAKYCDVILHVVDSSNPQMIKQMDAVYETLDKLEVKDKTILTAFNKQDLVIYDEVFRDDKADKQVLISAKKQNGIEELVTIIESILQEQKIYIEKTYSYQEANLIQLIRKYGQLMEESYTDEGILIKAFVPKEILNRI